MNTQTRQYFFALIFIGIGIYQAIKGQYLELALYGTAGLAFVMNSLTLEPRLIAYKKPLVIITWVFIAAAVLVFIYVLQFKYL